MMKRHRITMNRVVIMAACRAAPKSTVASRLKEKWVRIIFCTTDIREIEFQHAHYAKRCHNETPGHFVRRSPPPYLSRRNRFETSRLLTQISLIVKPTPTFKSRRCPGYCVVDKVHVASEDMGVDELMLVNGGDGQKHIQEKHVVEDAKHEVHFYWSPLAPHPSRSSPPQPPLER